MATFTAATAKSFTASAGVADDTTLTGGGRVIRLVHRGVTDPVWVTVGPTAALTPNPTVAGDNVFVVAPGQTAEFPIPPTTTSASVCVETLCASAQPVTIMVLHDRRQ
jgi:hypothetical protein